MLPKGQRLSISFERTFARGERVDGDSEPPGAGCRRAGFRPADDDAQRRGRDADRVVRAPLENRSAAAIWQDASIATGNQVVGFPGSYGLWLKRVGSEWRLVFNNEPDAWGSQHDPKFDAAEIPLTHSEGHAAARPFAVALMPDAADRGRLVIIWGPHEWTADFVVGELAVCFTIAS